MTNDSFKLPGASLEEVERVIEAFSQKGAPASNEEIAQIVGSASATVSRCNGFLVCLNLIGGGKKKEATELGKKLGLALHHGQTDETRKFWREIVIGNEFLSAQVTAVRVQKAIPVDDLPGKILYNSGCHKNQFMVTGARTVTDILLKAGFLSEKDGMYTVPKGATDDAESEQPSTSDAHEESKSNTKEPPVKTSPLASVEDDTGAQPIQLAVNLQIQIQEFEDTSKYEDLFKALRKHLLSPPKKNV